MKNNSCGGCHMTLPPQVVNEVRKLDRLVLCESCSRILFWKGE
ncbi:MAG: C4-type zinc ribbon domain-containing protein [bacterium]|nr:C4-type zinc ribbon domain-containing protein [bacterium]